MTRVHFPRVFLGISVFIGPALLALDVAGCGDDTAIPAAEDAAIDGTTETGIESSANEAASQDAPDAARGDAGDAAPSSSDAGSSDAPSEANEFTGLDAFGGDGGCDLPVPPLGSFLDTLANVACQHIRDCCGIPPSQFKMGLCTGFYSMPSTGAWLGVGFVAPYFDGGRINYDYATACQCLSETNTFNCGSNSQADFNALQTTCFAAVAGTSPLAGGCASSYECAAGAYCSPINDGGAGACAPLQPQGGACSAIYPSTGQAAAGDFACSYRSNPNPPLYCDPTSKACVPRLATGAACPANAACQSNHCVFANGAAACQNSTLGSTPAFCAALTSPDGG